MCCGLVDATHKNHSANRVRQSDGSPPTAVPTLRVTAKRECRHGPGQLAFVIGLFILAMFQDVVSGTNSFFYRDFGVWAYPDALYHRDCFWRGELALWNPYNNCGLPFLAQWNTLTLYPLSLIYLLLPMPWSLNVFCLFHLWLAGLGMNLLAYRWTGDRFAASVAGVAYALNGLTLHSLMWPNNIAAIGWLPLVILFAEHAWKDGGRWLVFAAIAGAIQMLAGAPEIILLTWFTIGALAAADLLRQKARIATVAWRLGWIVALTTLLSIAQLLPFFELITHSQRSVAFGDSTWSMPASGWANLLVPLFHQTRSIVGVYSDDSQQWTSSYYAGIAVIVLAVMAVARVPDRRVRALAALGLFALLMSMGEHSVLFRSVKTLIPQMGFFRFPIKFVVLLVFACPLLAAFAIQHFRKDVEARRTTIRWLPIVWSLTLVLIIGIIVVSHYKPVLNENWGTTLDSGVSRFVFLTLILGAIWVSLRVETQWQRFCVQAGAIVLIGLDAATHTPQQNPTIPTAVLKPNVAALADMPKLGEGRAMVSLDVQRFMDHAATSNLVQYFLGQRTTLFANCNLIDRIPKTSGFYSLYLREEAPVRSLFDIATNHFPSGLADFLGIVRISSSNDLFGWTARPTALPLITGGQQPIIADPATMLAALMNPRFASQEIVYLPAETGTGLQIRNRSEVKIEDTHVAAHRIEAVVESKTPALVIVAQAFDRAWRAKIDGKPAPLLRANLAFQAIEVPAGHHALTLMYRDSYFCIGLLVSLLTFFSCIGFAVLSAREECATG